MNQPQIQTQTLQVGSLRMQVSTQGRGPLVLLCHGFPELALSWRAQMAALADAGFRAAAPDMRGYGGSDAPAGAEHYSLLHLVGDVVGLVRALGETQAVIVGHDWGAPVAWHAALLRPDVFRAVAGLSVPYAPPSATDLLTALRTQGIHDFYLQYFQTPGVAEAELERDVASTLRRITWNASGEGPERVAFGRLLPGPGFLDGLVDPPTLPAWVGADPEEGRGLHGYIAAFTRTGFAGGLNWYRNFERNRDLLAAWRGAPVRQPSLFIAGTRDDVLKFPAAQAQIANYVKTLPGLRGCHLLEGAGHWVQRERAAEVNRLLIEFLRGL